MAQVIGLSQSQVYKWFWDQKKKNSRSKDSQKRKLIRKEYSNRDKEQLENKQYENAD